MPIRINLLAEAHAAEEMRRRDPVKRGIYAGAFLVACVVIWALTLQVKIVAANHELKTLETQWKAIYKDYQVAVDKRRRSLEVEQKLGALQALHTNRFLWGNALNAFQQGNEKYSSQLLQAFALWPNSVQVSQYQTVRRAGTRPI